MKCAVIGLGEFGTAAAIGLAKSGVEVIGVDIDLQRVNAVKDQLALAVRMDASQEDALEAHGIDDVDVLIAAIGSNFEAQVLIVVHAKQLGIKKIVARATTTDHRRVLKAVGADQVLNPEEEAARWVVQRLLITDISSYFELAEGFSVVEVNAPPGVIGKRLEELNLRRRFRINLVALKHMEVTPEGEKVLKQFTPVPLPDEIIHENDVLALVGSVIDLANFMGEYS
jgi:trk system potassium uptake protein